MHKNAAKPSSAAKKAEKSSSVSAALLKSEGYHRAVLAAMPDLMLGFSREGKILYHNAPDEDDLYAKPEDFIGKRIDEILPQKLGARYRRFIQTTLETGQIQHFEYPLPVPKGVQDFEARMVVSGPDEVLTIVRNITERKRAQEAVEESEKKFKSITENAADCIFVKDMARQYIFINPAMQKMLRLPKEGILGKTAEDIFGRDQARIVKEVDDRTFSGDTVDETRMLVVNDVELFFHTMQTPIAVENGTVTSILGIVRNVTERMQTEKRNLHDGVGQQLTGLRLLLAALRRELSTTHPEAARRVCTIEQIADDTLTSVRQISEGIEFPFEEPHTLVVALRKLACRVNELYGIRCRFTSRKPVLIQDAGVANHLFFIAQEAVTNALKHAKPGRIDISLSKRNRTLRLAVRDDGVGFSRKKKSEGIGLNIMRRRATLIGASFDVQAGKRAGTVVTCSWKTPSNATGRAADLGTHCSSALPQALDPRPAGPNDDQQ